MLKKKKKCAERPPKQTLPRNAPAVADVSTSRLELGTARTRRQQIMDAVGPWCLSGKGLQACGLCQQPLPASTAHNDCKAGRGRGRGGGGGGRRVGGDLAGPAVAAVSTSRAAVRVAGIVSETCMSCRGSLPGVCFTRVFHQRRKRR